MKKFFVLLTFLLFFVNNCFAAEWLQIADKTWLDTSTIQINGNEVSGWYKDLNPGDWDKIQNKKVWYIMSLFTANCNKRKLRINTSVSYDLKGNVLHNFTDNFVTYEDVIPGSVGEWKYEVLCRFKNNNSFNWDDYETEKP